MVRARESPELVGVDPLDFDVGMPGVEGGASASADVFHCEGDEGKAVVGPVDNSAVLIEIG